MLSIFKKREKRYRKGVQIGEAARWGQKKATLQNLAKGCSYDRLIAQIADRWRSPIAKQQSC